MLELFYLVKQVTPNISLLRIMCLCLPLNTVSLALDYRNLIQAHCDSPSLDGHVCNFCCSFNCRNIEVKNAHACRRKVWPIHRFSATRPLVPNHRQLPCLELEPNNTYILPVLRTSCRSVPRYLVALACPPSFLDFVDPPLSISVPGQGSILYVVCTPYEVFGLYASSATSSFRVLRGKSPRIFEY